jgi:hypothetical protein
MLIALQADPNHNGVEKGRLSQPVTPGRKIPANIEFELVGA